MPRIIATLILLFLLIAVAVGSSATSAIDDAGEAYEVQASSTAATQTTSNLIDVIMQKRNSFTVVKTQAVQKWMRSVHRRLDIYKSEHQKTLKEATTLLELALWKANLDDNERGLLERDGARTTRGQRKRAGKEICVTSGASIVIKNVLPYLVLK